MEYFWVVVILVGSPGQEQVVIDDGVRFQAEVQCLRRAQALALYYEKHPISTHCEQRKERIQPARAWPSCWKDRDVFGSAVVRPCNLDGRCRSQRSCVQRPSRRWLAH
jgi:hypothetical protein